MATKAKVKTLTNNSVDVLNAIRNSASTNYRDYVPVATDGNSIREIGAIIMDYPSLQNEFLNALVNRIGKVLMESKMYSNPWSMFKRGALDYGETIESIFVDLIKPFQYDPEVAESEVFKRENPNVKSAFHVLNYRKFYKTTVENDELRLAFLNPQGVTDLVAKIVDAMYASANLDEFLTMKYMLAKHIYEGMMYPVTIPEVTTDNMKKIVSVIKGVSNNFEFMSDKYNLAGVHNFVTKNDQYMIINANFDATMDVEVLASAFNMDKANFSGHRVLIDSFGQLDIERLNDLFKDEEGYHEFTTTELEALDKIPAVLVDKNWFMIFDNLYNFTEQYNAQGLYWNYFYHVWKTFSVSPFADNAVFITGTPSVTSVEVTPSAVTSSAGQKVQLSASVTVENYAPQSVTWSSETEGVTVNSSGVVTIGTSVTGTATIKATSTYDSTKSATCTITIA